MERRRGHNNIRWSEEKYKKHDMNEKKEGKAEKA